MTKGGPINSTRVLVYAIYQEAFVNFQFGAGSAAALILFAIIMVLTVIQFTFFRKEGTLPMITKPKAALMYALLVLLSLVVMFPVLYTFWSALLTPAEASKYPPPLLPSSFYMGNFIGVLAAVPIIDFIKNSFITAASITIGQLITASLAGYAFGLLQFKGKKLLFALFLSTMMVPSEVTMIPNYLTVKAWGWMDSYEGLTVPFMATAFGTFLLRQFFSCSFPGSCSKRPRLTAAARSEFISPLRFL